MNNHLILKNVVGISSLNTADFSSNWYSTVGVTILVVQIINILSGHSSKFFLYWWHRRCLAAAKSDPTLALTQAKLNNLHLGPHFQYAENYAQLMATLFTCSTFAAGMPLLYCIGAVNFFCSYFIDKFLFIFLYAAPPRLNERLGREAVGLIPWAIVLHTGSSIWMLGSQELFTTSGTPLSTTLANQNSAAFGTKYLADKITMMHTFILLVAFCIVSAATLLSTVSMMFEDRSTAFEASIPINSIAYHTNFNKAVKR